MHQYSGGRLQIENNIGHDECDGAMLLLIYDNLHQRGNQQGKKSSVMNEPVNPKVDTDAEFPIQSFPFIRKVREKKFAIRHQQNVCPLVQT